MEETEKREDDGTSRATVENYFYSKKRKRRTTYIIAAIVVGLIFSGRVIMSSQDSIEWIPDNSFLGRITHLVTSGDKELKGENNDRINVLLLGMGGKGHDGAYLTDTIMVVSIKPSTKQVAVISLPRDLSGPVDGSSSWQKINHVNAYAEMEKENSGGPATAQALSTLLQTPIDYYVRVDFNGFVGIIDKLGGVEVNVENTFDDYTYPIQGEEDNPDYYARFEHLHIDAGKQKMNGSLALKYARSRHSVGIEGSDFARARRQQIILAAVKDKLLSRQTLLNPVMLGKLITEFNNNVSTNLKTWEMLRLWDLSKNIAPENIISKVLNDAPNNYLVASIGDSGAFILTPKTGNFTEIRNMIQNIFYTETIENPIQVSPLGKGAKVAIMNGTWINGLATNTRTDLEKYDYDVVKVGNAPTRDYQNSIIYDLTYGDKNEPLESLQTLTNAKQIFNSPEWIKEYRDNAEEKADFILILGAKAE